MFVYAAQFHLHLPSESLKGKRGIVKSLVARIRQNFNVAAAEVDLQDVPGSAIIGVVSVSGNRVLARQALEKIEDWIVDERPDVDLVGADIEER